MEPYMDVPGNGRKGRSTAFNRVDQAVKYHGNLQIITLYLSGFIKIRGVQILMKL